ncbi:AAA family ATPase [Mangrovibacter phragmitis]|uniref:AAA family ATPase n=1 Tax=Mangrovibacter phragmitis TaxID=1691903 RepID=UPI00336A5297
MTQINHDEVRHAVKSMIENGGTTGATLARETGQSTAVISQFLNGKYRGDNDTVAQSINTWLETRKAAQHTLPAIPDYVATPTSETITAALTYAQLTHTIALVYGNPGVGKSEALKQYERTGNNVWRITASKSRTNELETMYELALAMGIADAPYQRGALSRLLRHRLRDTSSLIIIDEADWLNYDAIEELRILQEECNIGLAFTGNHKVYDRLTGGTRSVDFARLFSRVAKKVVINNIKAGDVDAFCDAWNVAGKDERQLLKAIAKRPGALRSLSHILPLAHIYASGKGEPVNTGHIHSAMLELGHADVNGE